MRVTCRQVLVGAGRVHRSHALRFNAQYVWCTRCGGVCTGRQAQALFGLCKGQVDKSNRHAMTCYRRLFDGKPPRDNVAPLEEQSWGRIVFGSCNGLLTAVRVQD